jgi:hypothetical protein
MTGIFVVFLIPSKRLSESYLKTAVASLHIINNFTLAVKARLKCDGVSENNKLALGVYALTVQEHDKLPAAFQERMGNVSVYRLIN